ncbi:L-threonylcarbamoyladenylate synthase [Zongyangia hominis]|uniref:Threonylcarbamoyl-AMP synthase n=1 Tax=Zongyangia hominis TaxID=2763677 RepID=A0A926I6L0_9FIRM|nr:L-threonylcarbamoyladenylate synthase [Zongyangia hominis]MBC8570164.1 threonylcarbamoyl-AMP synthase [Zongyangia hominis]
MNTQILPIEDPALTPDAVETAAKLLRAGGLVIIPTETVYGLAANALDGVAVRRIYEAKGRPGDNPLIVHVSDMEMIPPLTAQFPPAAQKLARAFWPGPLTIIVKKSGRIPYETSGGLDTVAIRMPSHPVARAIIAAAGLPLAAPSANLSGKPSPTNAARCIEDMMGRVDAIVDSGPCQVGVESTVITLAEGKPRLLRPGGVTVEALRRVLGEVEVDPAVLHQLEAGAKASSPGMKYKHYAPKAHVIILDGTLEQFVSYVETHKRGRTAALCFAGEESALPVRAFPYGKKDDPETQAKELFDRLRELDDAGEETVYARCPGKEGMGLAVYNRLIRAAGFEVVKL